MKKWKTDRRTSGGKRKNKRFCKKSRRDQRPVIRAGIVLKDTREGVNGEELNSKDQRRITLMDWIPKVTLHYLLLTLRCDLWDRDPNDRYVSGIWVWISITKIKQYGQSFCTKEVFEKIEPFWQKKKMAVYKRGRNSKSGSIAKENASMMDYRKQRSGSFGWIFISGRDMDRIIRIDRDRFWFE